MINRNYFISNQSILTQYIWVNKIYRGGHVIIDSSYDHHDDDGEDNVHHCGYLNFIFVRTVDRSI